MAKTYSASMLKVLEGLDAVRMRPGMYIGSTGSRGLHHLLWEIVDNAIDEVANGYARSVRVFMPAVSSITRITATPAAFMASALRLSMRSPNGLSSRWRPAAENTACALRAITMKRKRRLRPAVR